MTCDVNAGVWLSRQKARYALFFWSRVKLIFFENHCKLLAICRPNELVLDTSEGNKRVIQHPVGSVSALFMLLLSFISLDALFLSIHPAQRAFLAGCQSHPWINVLSSIEVAGNYWLILLPSQWLNRWDKRRVIELTKSDEKLEWKS